MHIRVRFDKEEHAGSENFRREVNVDVELVSKGSYEVQVKDNKGGCKEFLMDSDSVDTIELVGSVLDQVRSMP